MHTGIEDDQLKAGAHQHLRRCHRLLHRRRTDPEKTPEVDPCRRGQLRIEMIAEIDERCGFSHRRRRDEAGMDERESSRRATAGDLRHPAAGQTSFEKAVECVDRRRHELVPIVFLQRQDQFRSARDPRGNRRFQTLAEPCYFFPLIRRGRRLDQTGAEHHGHRLLERDAGGCLLPEIAEK
jgi:hypothetical protein